MSSGVTGVAFERLRGRKHDGSVCVLLEQPLDALQHSFIDNQNDVSILQSTRPLICRVCLDRSDDLLNLK
jgi:hypothetical protein